MALRPGRQRSSATPIIAKGELYPMQNPCASKSATHVFASKSALHHRKKHLLRQVLFSVKFVPAERVKYADACEIAYGSEMRFAREENEFHFTFCEAKYFTISARKLFHIRHKPNISLNLSILKFFEIL